MILSSKIKKWIRKPFHAVGLDIIRLQNSPRKTLIGLTSFDFCTIIDVGANEGQFARWISSFFPEAELYCFEPLESPYQKLMAWADTQNDRVHCFNLALGDLEGEVGMYFHVDHSASSSLLPATEINHQIYPQTRKKRIVKVQLSTMDKVLENHIDKMLPNILLKLDVQGFEDRVLRGAEHVLSVCKAVILEVNLDPFYNGQANFYELTRLLNEAGFDYAGNIDQIYGSDGRVLFLDAVYMKR